jgi:flagellar motor switch protein FliN/FliY
MALTESSIRAANEALIEEWRDHLDLMVQLAVELGRTKMKVREVLELEAHSIIQLQRSTGEGVDVLAGDAVMARGEIIMIEDRTGVRVNEIIMPEDQ